MATAITAVTAVTARTSLARVATGFAARAGANWNLAADVAIARAAGIQLDRERAARRAARRVETELQVIVRQAKRATAEAMASMAVRLEGGVRSGYQGLPHPDVGRLRGLSDFTLLKRQFGKRAGAQPAVPIFSGNIPLSRTGRLAQQVFAKARVTNSYGAGPGRFAEFHIGLQPGRLDPAHTGGGGAPLFVHQLAAILEQGAVFSVPLTTRSKRYLQLLQDRAAGPPDATSEFTGTVGVPAGQRVVVIPPRPIWGPVWRRFEARYIDEFVRLFMERYPEPLRLVSRDTMQGVRVLRL